MLGKDVCGIAGPVDLPEIDTSAPYCLLHPEQMGVKVSELTKSLAAADTNGCRRIGPDAQLELVAQVSHEALEPETHPGTADGPIEFCLS